MDRALASVVVLLVLAVLLGGAAILLLAGPAWVLAYLAACCVAGAVLIARGVTHGA